MQPLSKSGDSTNSGTLAFQAVLATFIGLVPTVYATCISNSIALFSDFLRCFVEFLAVLFAWLIVRKIHRTDRSDYNFGFGKFEHVGSLALACAMFISFLILGFLVQHRVLHPVELHSTNFGLCVSTLAVFANAAVGYHYFRHSKRTPSPLITSQWKLFRAKTVASAVVVFSLLAAMFFQGSLVGEYADPVGSTLVALFLLYSGYSIVSNSMNDLVDRSIEEAFQLSIMGVLVRHEQLYRGFQGVRSRCSGARMYVDIFLEFDSDSSMGEVSKAIAAIQADLKTILPHGEVNIVASAAS